MNAKTKVKENMNAMKLAQSGVLVALGILLPQTFHMFGPNAGMTFLPMEFPVLLAGMMLGPTYGGLTGGLIPILSSVLTGMPAVPKVYFMAAGYAAYGVAGGRLIRRYNIYISLIMTMLIGRIINGITLMAGFYIFGMRAPFMNVTAFFAGILMGIPGMVIQILVIPCLYMMLRRGGLIFE